MKKKLLFILVVLVVIVFAYGESRKFLHLDDGKYVTVWKTYDDVCYIVPGRYYGLLKPSVLSTYIKTTNRSTGVDIIWKKESDTLLAQVDSNSQIFNGRSDKVVIVNYNLNQRLNDSLYTYFDNKLKVRRYKKGINILSIPINDMGAL